jgi:farnesyl-diphosphate farnesyltransferase
MKASIPATNDILKRVSRSLYLSIRALPGSMRPVFSTAYLLCRAADSITDGSRLPRHRRIYWIEKFPALLINRRLRGAELDTLVPESAAAAETKGEKELLAALPEIFACADSLPQEELRLVYEVLSEVCGAMTEDLSVFGQDTATLRAFQTPAQLEKYCRRIGGGPGIFWTRAAMLHADIKSCGDTLAEQGRQIGEALQLVNILRDTPRDLRRGRCYWPQNELEEAGLQPQDLLSVAAQPRLRKILRKWTLETIRKITCAEEYVSCLPRTQFRLRSAVIWPIYWGLDTLQEIWKAENFLDPQFIAKMPRARIYFTVAKTSATLASDVAFIKGFRLRRETLLSTMSSKID